MSLGKLKKAAKNVVKNWKTQKWNTGAASAYLKNCFNEKAQKSIVTCAMNCQEKKFVLTNETKEEKRDERKGLDMSRNAPAMEATCSLQCQP